MSQPLPQIETALRELTKLIKAVRYYPAGHPAVVATASETRTAFLPLLDAGRNLTLRVRKEGFFLDEAPVATDNPVLRKLAAFLFSRLVQTLVILPDLSTNDLIGFGRALEVDPREIRRHGGIKELLLKARLTTIWVNETDLEQILAHKQEIEIAKDKDAGGGGEDGLPDFDFGERDLKTVIDELRREQDDHRFAALLDELVPLARLCQNPAGRLRLLEALALLCQLSADRSAGLSRREAAWNALKQLSQPELIDFLIDFLCDREIAGRHRELLLRILGFLRQSALERLMERLAEEKVAARRKILSNALARQGSRAVPLLATYLQDERWYVVRNAVNILGEIRDPAATRHLHRLLHHEDTRVCRETIRALTRIGGPGAARILLDIIDDDDEEISRQAILSLGVIGDESAVPGLLKIVRKGDFFCKQSGRKKEAIRALGEIGSPEALPALTTILKTRRFFKRREQNELRAAAAQAIGEIGDPHSVPLLEQAARDRSLEVARQAATALKLLSRIHG